MTKVRSSKKALSVEDQRTATAKRDEQFFQERRAREAVNLKRTLELRAQRLAHQAAEKARKVAK